MGSMLEPYAAPEEAQWCGMNDWQEDREIKWDNHHRDNVIWGVGIADMTGKVLPTATVGKPAPTQQVRQDEREESTRQDGHCLGASRHTGEVQGGEPEERQLLQQLKSKLALKLKQQSEQQHQPKPERTLTVTSRWETVQPRTQNQRVPAGPGPTATSGSSMAE
jgi:hypothetical protein